MFIQGSVDHEDHPGPEQLQALLDRITEEGARRLLLHLLECPRCAAFLLGLMDDSVDSLPDFPSSLDTVPPS